MSEKVVEWRPVNFLDKAYDCLSFFQNKGVITVALASVLLKKKHEIEVRFQGNNYFYTYRSEWVSWDTDTYSQGTSNNMKGGCFYLKQRSREILSIESHMPIFVRNITTLRHVIIASCNCLIEVVTDSNPSITLRSKYGTTI